MGTVEAKKGVIPLKDLKMLVVEDNKFNQLLATKLLNSIGVEPQIASDGIEAVDKVKTQNFDLILMDILMPNMDGIEATKAIRAMNDIEQPKIIAVTATDYDEYRQNCNVAGMNDFLMKPMTRASLEEKLQMICTT